MELLPLKVFVEQLNSISEDFATISGMKRRAEQGRLPAQKNGRKWLVEVSSPEAQAFFTEAKLKAEAQGKASEVAGLEMNLRTSREVNENLSFRLKSMIEANEELRNRCSELERKLEIAEAKLEVALQLSGVKPKVVVKKSPGREEIDWSSRYEEWAQHQTRPTITAFAKEVGVPRTTINAALNRAKRKSC